MSGRALDIMLIVNGERVSARVEPRKTLVDFLREDLALTGSALYLREGSDVTILFRVRNKEKTHYCYSEAERDKAAQELGKSCEITRFKGLGEISPAEFKQFIGENMRLSRVEHAPKMDAQNIFGFYMGKNTPERKDYIMENLVVPVEE